MAPREKLQKKVYDLCYKKTPLFLFFYMCPYIMYFHVEQSLEIEFFWQKEYVIGPKKENR